MRGRIIKSGSQYGVQVKLMGCWVDEAGANGPHRWKDKPGAERYAKRNGIELQKTGK